MTHAEMIGAMVLGVLVLGTWARESARRGWVKSGLAGSVLLAGGVWIPAENLGSQVHVEASGLGLVIVLFGVGCFASGLAKSME